MAHGHTRRRLVEILRSVDPVHLGGISGTAAILWGAWVAWPSVTFKTISYTQMDKLMPEWGWGWAMMVVGAAQLWATLSHRSWQLRATANFVMALVWSFIALLFGISNPATTAVPMYTGLALISCWAYVRRVADEDGS